MPSESTAEEKFLRELEDSILHHLMGKLQRAGRLTQEQAQNAQERLRAKPN